MLLCIEPQSAQTSCLPGMQEAGCPSTVRESFRSATAEASAPKLESPFFDFSAVFGGEGEDSFQVIQWRMQLCLVILGGSCALQMVKLLLLRELPPMLEKIPWP